MRAFAWERNTKAEEPAARTKEDLPEGSAPELAPEAELVGHARLHRRVPAYRIEGIRRRRKGWGLGALGFGGSECGGIGDFR